MPGVLGEGLTYRTEVLHLVEKQTGGKQVLWPVHDVELKAESPRGLGPSLSLKKPEAKRPSEQTWNMQEALRPLKTRIGVWDVNPLRELAGAAGSPLCPYSSSPPPSHQVSFRHSPWSPPGPP